VAHFLALFLLKPFEGAHRFRAPAPEHRLPHLLPDALGVRLPEEYRSGMRSEL
jgi:hypothetical protein